MRVGEYLSVRECNVVLGISDLCIGIGLFSKTDSVLLGRLRRNVLNFLISYRLDGDLRGNRNALTSGSTDTLRMCAVNCLWRRLI